MITERDVREAVPQLAGLGRDERAALARVIARRTPALIAASIGCAWCSCAIVFGFFTAIGVVAVWVLQVVVRHFGADWWMPTTWSTLILIIIVGAMALGGLLGTRLSNRNVRMYRRALVREALHESVGCLRCGYDTTGVPPAAGPEGFARRTCPECGFVQPVPSGATDRTTAAEVSRPL